MTIKVWLKKGKSEIIETPHFRNFCQVHVYLNEKYGLKGWEGYEIV